MAIQPNAIYAYIPQDPIHKEDGKWYFWIETWSERLGEFTTEEEARRELERYCLWLEGKLPEQQLDAKHCYIGLT